MQQIEKHEAAHSALIFEALARMKSEKRDPARLIEKMASNDETRLRAAAGVSISDASRTLCRATQHPYVFPRLDAFANDSGTILDTSGNIIATVPSLKTFANDNFTCD